LEFLAIPLSLLKIPVKRFLLQFIICLTCFNLAGGYAFAVGVFTHASRSVAPTDTHLSEGVVIKTKTGIDVRTPQINKEESEDDDAFVFTNIALPNSLFTYQFIPDFKLLNKHFLVHYGKAIKGSFPSLYIVNSVFRL
jgi:hypothetical protein